mmetsp:Transcript_14943/g.27001  ORF Transcript_14943/g.27001 Transcript_14943/m.27001 type:complete len:218 (+) Transcript_14943:749-1402(+)
MSQANVSRQRRMGRLQRRRLRVSEAVTQGRVPHASQVVFVWQQEKEQATLLVKSSLKSLFVLLCRIQNLDQYKSRRRSKDCVILCSRVTFGQRVLQWRVLRLHFTRVSTIQQRLLQHWPLLRALARDALRPRRLITRRTRMGRSNWYGTASRHPSSLMTTRRFHYFRLLSLHPLITMERMVLFSVVPTMLEPVSYVILHQDDSTHVDCAVSKNGRCQ